MRPGVRKGVWDLAVHAGQIKDTHGRFHQLLTHWGCTPMRLGVAAPITNHAEFWRRGSNHGDTSDQLADGRRRNHSRGSRSLGNERLYRQHRTGNRT